MHEAPQVRLLFIVGVLIGAVTVARGRPDRVLTVCGDESTAQRSSLEAELARGIIRGLARRVVFTSGDSATTCDVIVGGKRSDVLAGPVARVSHKRE